MKEGEVKGMDGWKGVERKESGRDESDGKG